METRVRESKEQKVLSENKIEADVFYPWIICKFLRV